MARVMEKHIYFTINSIIEYLQENIPFSPSKDSKENIHTILQAQLTILRQFGFDIQPLENKIEELMDQACQHEANMAGLTIEQITREIESMSSSLHEEELKLFKVIDDICRGEIHEKAQVERYRQQIEEAQKGFEHQPREVEKLGLLYTSKDAELKTIRDE